MPFHKFHQKLAKSDVTKEALNCTELRQCLLFIAADSIVDALSFIRRIVKKKLIAIEIVTALHKNILLCI